MKRKRKPATIGQDRAMQCIKVTAVMLRDESWTRLDEALEAFIYCWRHTESQEAAEAREAKEVTT